MYNTAILLQYIFILYTEQLRLHGQLLCAQVFLKFFKTHFQFFFFPFIIRQSNKLNRLTGSIKSNYFSNI